MYGKQKEKQRKKLPKIPEKGVCIQYTIYNYCYFRGLRGLPLTRGKNVLHFAYLANPARVALYGKKEFADGKKGSL